MRVVTAMLAACLLAAVVYGQTFQPGGPVVLRDANQRLVGQMVDSNDVSVNINGHSVLLIARRSELTSGDGLWFDQLNCQGNAYITSATVSFGPPSTPAFFAPDGTVRISPSLQETTLTLKSHYSDIGVPLCQNQTFLLNALSTEVGPNLKSMFQPPFSMGEGTVNGPAALSNVPTNSILYLALLLGILAVIAIVRLK